MVFLFSNKSSLSPVTLSPVPSQISAKVSPHPSPTSAHNAQPISFLTASPAAAETKESHTVPSGADPKSPAPQSAPLTNQNATDQLNASANYFMERTVVACAGRMPFDFLVFFFLFGLIMALHRTTVFNLFGDATFRRFWTCAALLGSLLSSYLLPQFRKYDNYTHCYIN